VRDIRKRSQAVDARNDRPVHENSLVADVLRLQSDELGKIEKEGNVESTSREESSDDKKCPRG
jgi:hypothetical protein